MSQFQILSPESEEQPTSAHQYHERFTRAFVSSLEPRVKLVDSKDGVDLFSYSNLEEGDSDAVRQCRGIVFNKGTLILKGYGHTDEYTCDEFMSDPDLVLDGCRVFEAHEGTLIRMFFTNNHWFQSTHRRLDAYRSKWAGDESFGHTFASAMNADNGPPTYTDLLDKERQYMFLLCNTPANRIVCNAPEKPTVYHVGTFHQGKLLLDDDIGIDRPREYIDLSKEDAVSVVNEISPERLQGLIVIREEDASTFKIISKSYKEYAELRGNEPSVRFRYLQIRMDMPSRAKFMDLYPEWISAFDEYEDILYEVVLNLKDAYIRRYIKKEFITVPNEEFGVIKEIHKWHVEDRVNNHVNADIVRDALNRQPPSKLNKIIRKYLLLRREAENEAYE